MKGCFVLICLLCIFIQSCPRKEERIEPAYPTEVAGWKETNEHGVRTLGAFVLRPNEIADNGKLRIKAIEILPGNMSADYGSYGRQAKVKLQFAQSSDQKFLCEGIFLDMSSMDLSSDKCGSALESYGVTTIYIRAINVRDKWVHFSLGG
jgi:hypothetical protein